MKNQIKKIVFSKDGDNKTKFPQDCTEFFRDVTYVETIDLAGADGSDVNVMSFMFADNALLESIDFTGFNASRITFMSSMFSNCGSLLSVNLSGLTSKFLRDMSNMFNSCMSLTSLDLTPLNTENVTAMFGLFKRCVSLISVDLSSFNTSKVKKMQDMFNYCLSLTSLDLSGFDTGALEYTDNMFNDCASLERVTLGEKVVKLGMLPESEVKGHANWYSSDEGKWMTSSEIAGRLGTADTYSKEEPTHINTVTISGIVAKTYTGSEITQTPRLTDGNKVLIENTDYTLSYQNNINPGTATVIIKGKGGYGGSVSKTFTINPKSISGVTVTGIVAKTYTGSPLTQSPRLTDGNYAMREGVDYTLSYKNNVNPGKATVIIKGIGKYTGQIVKNFTITAAIKPSKPVIVVQPKKQITIKSGSTKPFTVSIKAKATRGGMLLYQWYSNGKAIKGATKATFTVKNPSTIKPGTYKLQCVVTEQLLGGKTVNKSSVSMVAIQGPLSVLQMTSKGKSSLEFSWNKVSVADGYDLFFTRCNYGKTVTKYKKAKTIKGANNTTFVKTKLLANTCYKAFVRPFKIVSGKKVYLAQSPKRMPILMVAAKNILIQKPSHLTNQR